MGIVPAVIVLGGLVALVPPPTVQRVTMNAPGVWLLVMEFVVLLHLTVLFSLTVKWGALAMAVATLLILNALLALPFSLVLAGLAASYDDDDRATIGPIIYIGCACAAVLQVMIAYRIRHAAAR